MRRLIRNSLVLAVTLCAAAALAQQPPKRPLGVPAAGPTPAVPAATAPKPQANSGLPSLEDLTATRERPLFSSTRRPPEVEPPPQVAGPITEATSMPFELVGIVLGSDVNAAIFRNTDTKEETRIAKGEKIGNWNLEEITERAVVLKGGDKRVRMRLFNEAKMPGLKIGRSGDESAEPDQAEASDNEEQVDEDISPTNSPQVRPATAQPKPPPSLQNRGQRPRRPLRGIPRQRQEP